MTPMGSGLVVTTTLKDLYLPQFAVLSRLPRIASRPSLRSFPLGVSISSVTILSEVYREMSYTHKVDRG